MTAQSAMYESPSTWWSHCVLVDINAGNRINGIFFDMAKIPRSVFGNKSVVIQSCLQVFFPPGTFGDPLARSCHFGLGAAMRKSSGNHGSLKKAALVDGPQRAFALGFSDVAAWPFKADIRCET